LTQEKLSTSDEPDDSAAAPAAAAWPKKLAEQIAAVRDLVTKGATDWSRAEVAAAFKGVNKADVEEVLDGLAALGILAVYDARGERCWKSTRARLSLIRLGRRSGYTLGLENSHEGTADDRNRKRGTPTRRGFPLGCAERFPSRRGGPG
jgi:hypothetical protein